MSPSRFYLLHGDSKTAVGLGREWDYKFEYYAENITNQGWADVANFAVGGLTVINAQATIDADLAAVSATPIPEFALINFGANDSKTEQTEATWKAAYLYILDAIHTKWSTTKLYLMRAWQRDYPDNCDILAGWIADIVAARDFVYLGPDERVFLENGDDGATYMADASHPNELGRDKTAAEWVDLVL